DEKKKIYSVQLGAFKQLDNALSMVDRIRKLGHHPFYRHETIEGRGKLYIVYTGKYGSSEEAEKGVKILRKSNIASTYLIRSWDNKKEILERADSRLVIKEITYQLGTDRKERVLIHSNGKFSPIVFALEVGIPKSVIDIIDVDAFGKNQAKILINGELIKQIRTHLHQDSKTLRVVLDLSPYYKNYKVNQIFYEAENVYVLEVEVEEQIETEEKEKMAKKNCWSSDTNGPERAWKANFHVGYIIDNSIDHKNSVRAVRSLPSMQSKVGH
ncbi:MAG: SPOR domain-containing protein, partial [Deltaproteobacteria bacterium]|nr:SPOR domain-containing protein [Deltaproteobacteria bacterium]